MPAAYEQLKVYLRRSPQKWLVTGAAGFIGSHLVESLLLLDQEVVGLDNFSTGHRHNLDDVKTRVSSVQWGSFRFHEGDITRLGDCHVACTGVNCVLHQAALGSVPRSLADPLRTHANNVDGFVTMLEAARVAGVATFVYASSSSVYGDHPDMPKVESRIGRPLSPYAATKFINEVYAGIYSRSFGLPTVGLRYFNVFGPRQDPNGAYAAVMPRWFAAARSGAEIVINGDGETSRDFCYIANVVQANLLAATSPKNDAISQVYNVAAAHRTTLNELYLKIQRQVSAVLPEVPQKPPRYVAERAGDVRHSLADISLIQSEIGYVPTHDVDQGLVEAADWYLRSLN